MTLLPQPWLSPRDTGDGPGIRLFCLPHAGSGSAIYNRWRQLLPQSVRVCPILLPGREMRLAEPPAVSASRLALDLLDGLGPLLTAPYAIFGHSMGALIGYELARQIAQAGLPGPRVLFCSGRNAPNQPMPHATLNNLPDEEFVEALRARYGGIPEGFLQEPELRQVFLPILRADLRLVERYKPLPGTLLHCPVWASAGTSDRMVSDAGLAGWQATTSAGVTTARFPGDHFYHLGPAQTELLAWIGEALTGGEITSSARS